MSRESGRLAGMGEPDAVECRGLEESLRYSNMIMVTMQKRKGNCPKRAYTASDRMPEGFLLSCLGIPKWVLLFPTSL